MSGENTREGRGVGLALLLAVTGLAVAGLIPSVAAAAPTASIANGDLSVVGDTGDDQIAFSDQNDPACPGGPPCYEVDYTGSGPITAAPPCVAVSPSRVLCPAASVDSLRAVGREGKDELLVGDFAFGLTVGAVLDGGADDDAITGSDGLDRLIGGDDNDDLDGRRANDVLLGGIGRDRLDGARGNDRLFGNFGPDHLIGGTGADSLFGGAGRDLLDGQQARDLCNGGKQKDRARNCERRVRIA